MPPVDPSPQQNPVNDWTIAIVPTTGNTIGLQASVDGIDLAFDLYREFRNKGSGLYLTVVWRSATPCNPFANGEIYTPSTDSFAQSPSPAPLALYNHWDLHLVSETRDGLWRLISWIATRVVETFGSGFLDLGEITFDDVEMSSSMYKAMWPVTTKSEVPYFAAAYGPVLISHHQFASENILDETQTTQPQITDPYQPT